jgi:hypothetical protein
MKGGYYMKSMNGRMFAFAELLVIAAPITSITSAARTTAFITFTDDFLTQASALWSNSIGNWTSASGAYFAQAASDNPFTYSGLPFDFTNSHFSVTATITIADSGFWLDTDGTTHNAIGICLSRLHDPSEEKEERGGVLNRGARDERSSVIRRLQAIMLDTRLRLRGESPGACGQSVGII